MLHFADISPRASLERSSAGLPGSPNFPLGDDTTAMLGFVSKSIMKAVSRMNLMLSFVWFCRRWT